jgi:hypothetical protein
MLRRGGVAALALFSSPALAGQSIGQAPLPQRSLFKFFSPRARIAPQRGIRAISSF